MVRTSVIGLGFRVSLCSGCWQSKLLVAVDAQSQKNAQAAALDGSCKP